MNVQRTCMRKSIRDLIVSRILDGTYPAGTRLKEMVLAKEFETSQAPVREALRELEATGMVVTEHYRGTRVHTSNINDLKEAYELRGILEERAAQMAVPCNAETLANLQVAFEVMVKALADDDYNAYTTAAATFHRTLITASGNATFMRVWDSLRWDIRARIVGQMLKARAVPFKSFVVSHETILDHLRAGDGVAAGREVLILMKNVQDALASAPIF